MTALLRGIHRIPRSLGRTWILHLAISVFRQLPSAYGPILLADRHDWTNRACITGLYGYELFNLIHDLPKNAIFMDIGANCGVFSMVAAAHLSDGKVYAFEPNPVVFAKLAANISLNKAANISPFCFGLARSWQLCRASVNPHHTGMSHILPEAAPGQGSQAFVLVPADQIASLICPAEDAEILCKIDVEGSEFETLQALDEARLLERISKLYVEIDQDLLARQGAALDDIYELASRCRFSWTKGKKEDQHYDELFYRPRADK